MVLSEDVLAGEGPGDVPGLDVEDTTDAWEGVELLVCGAGATETSVTVIGGGGVTFAEDVGGGVTEMFEDVETKVVAPPPVPVSAIVPVTEPVTAGVGVGQMFGFDFCAATVWPMRSPTVL